MKEREEWREGKGRKEGGRVKGREERKERRKNEREECKMKEKE